MDIFKWLRNEWDRSVAVAAVVFGVVALILGYLGVSRSTLATQQIPYLASGGLAGLFALGLGATLWLSADLRDEWRKLDRIHQDLKAEQVNLDQRRRPGRPGEATGIPGSKQHSKQRRWVS